MQKRAPDIGKCAVLPQSDNYKARQKREGETKLKEKIIMTKQTMFNVRVKKSWCLKNTE